MKNAVLVGVALLALTACGSEAETPVDQAAPATEAQAAPAASGDVAEAPAAAAVDLSAYVGKYPFDVVNGHRFLDHPAVKAAIAAAVPDATTREAVKFEENGLGLPIVRVDGGRILAWGGAKRAEDRYNWAVVIASDGSKPEVCIYDGVGYEDDFQAAQWFVPGEGSIMKQGKCPSADEDYPAADIAAG